MELKSGGRILRAAGAPRQTFVAKSTKMVFLSVMGNRVCAVVLPDTTGDRNQSDSRTKLLSVGTEMTSGQQTTGADHRDLTEGNAMKNNGDALRREHAAEEVPDSQEGRKNDGCGK